MNTQTKNMKIKTSITQEREIEITLPIFRKQINTASIEYIGVIEESHGIKMYINEDAGHTQISVTPMWLLKSDVVKAVNDWQEVDEYEFLQAHEDALQSLSLAPKLSIVDQEIEKELSQKDDLKNIEFS